MNAELITKLIEAGTPPALVAEVALELGRAAVAQEILEGRRAKDRERKRVPRNSEESTESAEFQEMPSPLAPPLKSPPDPEKITPPITPQPIAGCARPKFAAPDGVTAEQWKAFRQQRKKPLNERSYVLLCNKLSELAEAGWPPGEMIDRAIDRGWETVFEPKDQKNGRTDSMGRHQPADGLSSTARAAIAVFGAPGAGRH